MIKPKEVWYNNTYAEDNGRYQKLSDAIDELIPPSGEAATDRLNLYRVTSNAYRDMHRNGGWNRCRFQELWIWVQKFKTDLLKNGMTRRDIKTLKWMGTDPSPRAFDIVQNYDYFQMFERLADASILIAQSELTIKQ